MSKTRSPDEVARAAGAGKRDMENWRARLELTTKFEPTTQGVPRRYSKENALEFAFMTPLVRAGVSPKAAAAYARNLLQNLKDHRLGLRQLGGEQAQPLPVQLTDDVGVRPQVEAPPRRPGEPLFAATTSRSDPSANTWTMTVRGRPVGGPSW